MKRLSSPLLIVFFPLLTVLVELGVAVGSNFLLVHEVGGSRIPAYIRIPLIILCTFVSFLVALYLMRMAYKPSQTQRSKVLTSMAALFVILMLAAYGYFRLEFPGVIVYEWDTVVDCCTPTGEVSGIYVLICSGSAVIGMMSYSAFRFLRRLQSRK